MQVHAKICNFMISFFMLPSKQTYLFVFRLDQSLHHITVFSSVFTHGLMCWDRKYSSIALAGNSISAVRLLREIAVDHGDHAAVGSRCIDAVLRWVLGLIIRRFVLQNYTDLNIT